MSTAKNLATLAAAVALLTAPPLASAAGPFSLWTSTQVPAAGQGYLDPNPAELGVRFRADSSGTVTGIRFFKIAGNNGVHVGHLWTNAGTLLGTANFSVESSTGWQTAAFASAIPIQASTTYVASFHTTSGYAATRDYFLTARDNAPLRAPASAPGALNGVYAYSTNTVFPTQSSRQTNYWVDVVFSVPESTPTPPPGCLLSAGSWQNVPFPTQSGSFSATFNATPGQTGMDGVAGFSNGPAAGFPALASVVRFNTAGFIDARNGGAYAADISFPYSPGTAYRFRLDVNLAAHSYSVFVASPSAPERLLANNFAFRSEQGAVASLNNLGLLASTGSELVCGLAVSSAPAVGAPPSLSAIAVSPLSASVPVGGRRAFRAVGTYTDGSTVTLSGPWSGLSPLPTARRDLQAAASGGVLYAIGGFTTRDTTTVEAYAPLTDSWSTKAPLTAPNSTVSSPTPDANRGRYQGAAASVNGRIYMIGGWTTTPGLPSDTLSVYDPTADAWSAGPTLPERSACSQAAVIGTKIYVLSACNGFPEYRRSLFIFDTLVQTWTTGPDAPRPHTGGAGAALDGKFYVTGGRDEVARPEVDVYDPATNLWTTVGVMPAALYAMAGDVIGGRWYLAGGSDAAGQGVDSLWAYSPASNTWTQGPAMPTARGGAAAAAIGGKLYVAGGGSVDVLEVFDPAPKGVAWSSESPSVATVAASGYASGLAGGTARIVASSGALSGGAFLTVVSPAPPPPQPPPPPSSTTTFSLWTTQGPAAGESYLDPNPLSLGVRFFSDVPGQVAGVRFYKVSNNTGPHTARLYTSTGGVLGSVAFVNETASGWQTASFPTPIAIASNTVYVASYHSPTGYSATRNYFNVPRDSPPLHAPANTAGALNGRYFYGASPSFPTNSYLATNYWVDVVFSQAGSTAPAPSGPVLSSLSPSSATAGGPAFTMTVTGQGFTPASGPMVFWNGEGRSTEIVSDTTLIGFIPAADIASHGTATVTVRRGPSGPFSNALPFTVNPSSSCRVSAGTWQNLPFSAQTGAFEATFEARPEAAGMDGVAGFSSGPAGGFDDMASIVRFNPAGFIDARDAGAYAAQASIPYAAGTYYRFRLVVDVPSHRYTAYVGAGSSAEQLLAAGYAFRTEQSAVGSLDHLALHAATGSESVCNLRISTTGASNPVPAIAFISPASAPAGAAGFTLEVRGSNFVVGSRIHWNGADRTTTFTSTSALSASIPGGDAASPGTAMVTVFNPGPGGGTSNGAAFQIVGSSSVPWTMTGSMLTTEAGAAVRLSDGKVLLVKTATAELYDPGAGTWAAVADPPARGGGSLTLLPSGKVLLAGGRDLGGRETNLAWLFDPLTRTWSPTGTMPDRRDAHTATLLPGGMVLVAGGHHVEPSGSAFLYDPATGGWTAPSSMGRAFYGHSATLLADGRVLVAGGAFDPDTPTGASYIPEARVYNPATGAWTATGVMTATRSWAYAALLPSGKVLVAGVDGLSAELYDPATNAWSATGALSGPQRSAVRLPDGRVLAAGRGASTELYSPVSGLWSSAGAMTVPRFNPALLALADGKVLAAGGTDGEPDQALTSAELFTPSVPPSLSPAPPPSSTATVSLWTTQGPASNEFYRDPNPITLGVRFFSDVSGFVTGVRFYKLSANDGAHTARLYTSTGGILGSASFINETATGWQTASFPTPVAIASNTLYVAAYHSPTGYAATRNSFTVPRDNPPLHAPANAAGALNGRYVYGAGPTFPTNGYQATNYWVDVAFAQTAPTSPPPSVGPAQLASAARPAAADPAFGLKASYAFPNPARGVSGVTIRVQPGLADGFELNVYDLAGRRVHASSVFQDRGAFDDGNGLGPQFTYEHVWDVSGVGSGVYIYAVTARKAGQGDILKHGKVGVVK